MNEHIQDRHTERESSFYFQGRLGISRDEPMGKQLWKREMQMKERHTGHQLFRETFQAEEEEGKSWEARLFCALTVWGQLPERAPVAIYTWS